MCGESGGLQPVLSHTLWYVGQMKRRIQCLSLKPRDSLELTMHRMSRAGLGLISPGFNDPID